MDATMEKVKREFKDKFCNSMLVNANQMRKTGVLCDVILRCEDKELPAHRSILSSGSEYFYGVFTNQMKEDIEGVIDCSHFDSDTIETILEFLYTGEITLKEDTAEVLVAAADYMLIPSLKELGTIYLKKQITSYNCFSLYKFSKHYNCQDLENLCSEFISLNFERLCFTEELKHLDLKFLLDFIQRDDIVISREEIIFEAILEWVYHDLEQRKQHFESLFRCLRLPSVSKYYLADYVEQEKLVQESQQCRELLFQHFRSIALPDRQKTGTLIKPRKYLAKEETGIIITGWTYLTNLSDQTECFLIERTSDNESWLKLADRQYPGDEHATVMCENFLYSIGGNSKTNTVERYDPRIDSWSKVAPLLVKCASAAAVTVEGYIYVLGGRDIYRPYNTVQCYDPVTNSWSMKSPMIENRKSLSAVVLDGYIYAIGGINEKGLVLNGVESYDPGQNKWRHETTMNSRRTLACATVLNRKIYVIGGYEKESMTPLSSCEVFDPDNAKWTIFPDLLMRRAAAGITNFNGKIYIFGGVGENGALNDIECYDDETNAWSIVATMPAARAYIQCHVAKFPIKGPMTGQLDFQLKDQ